MVTAATQCAYLLEHNDHLLVGLADQHRAWAPHSGFKTAGWLLGHLIITGDFGRRLCGRPPLAPKEWRSLFAPGTVPTSDADAYPPMASIIDTFRGVYADFAANAPLSPPDLLAVPNPYEPARGAFATAGTFVTYLLTGHLAYHLGQLSQWRILASVADPRLRPS